MDPGSILARRNTRNIGAWAFETICIRQRPSPFGLFYSTAMMTIVLPDAPRLGRPAHGVPKKVVNLDITSKDVPPRAHLRCA